MLSYKKISEQTGVSSAAMLRALAPAILSGQGENQEEDSVFPPTSPDGTYPCRRVDI